MYFQGKRANAETALPRVAVVDTAITGDTACIAGLAKVRRTLVILFPVFTVLYILTIHLFEREAGRTPRPPSHGLPLGTPPPRATGRAL